MREFFLENEYGQTFGMNSTEKGFLRNPKGLGYKLTAAYTKIGGSWVRNTPEDAQATISAELVVGTKSPYEAVQDFFRFVRGSKELILHRVTPAGEYLKDVDLLNVEVTEIGEGDYLYIPVSFAARSLWYKKVDAVYQVSTEVQGAKRYAYPYPYKYVDFSNGEVTVENDGSVAAPLQVVINGPVSDPVISMEVDGEETARVEISGQAAAGETIEWSSRDGRIYCEKVAGGQRTNLVPDFDIANTNFWKAPVGSSTFKFTAGSALVGTIILTMYKQYRAV